MFRDPLQERLKEMELDNPSKSNYPLKFGNYLKLLSRRISEKVEQVPQKEHIFGDLNDELNYFRGSQDFDNSSLDEKVRICRQSIEKTDYSSGLKDDLTTFLEDALSGENPRDFHYDYFEEIEETAVPQTIMDMINRIYIQVAPTEVRKNAAESYEHARKHWEYASEHAESGSALTNALFSLSSAADYLIDSCLGNGVGALHKEFGDRFFQSAVKLAGLDKNKEARHSVWIVIKHYQNGNVDVPEELLDNWKKYAYSETDNLRTDWETSSSYSFERLLPAPGTQAR